jgi:hypothetical protein
MFIYVMGVRLRDGGNLSFWKQTKKVALKEVQFI